MRKPPAPAPGQVRRRKSPGRVAAARRLNALGLAGPGGRRPSHGLIALERRLREGLDRDTYLGRLHARQRAGYVTDLGGEEACSAMELGVCDRLADLDLVRGLLNAQREGTRKIASARALFLHVQALTRNVLAYVQAVRLVGPGRRAKDIPDPFREAEAQFRAEALARQQQPAEERDG